MHEPPFSDDAQPGGKKAPGAESERSPLAFAFALVVGLVSGAVSAVAVASLLPGLGVVWGLAVAVLPAVALPLFLAVRAGRALKRRGLRSLPRHLITLLLVAAVHLAAIGVALEWGGRTGADLAATAGAALEATVGEVPLLSGIFAKAAEGATVRFGEAPAPASDAGPASDADAGTGAATIADGGPKAPESPLSPRQDRGRQVRVFAALVKNDVGDPLIVVSTLKAGGKVTSRVVSLDEHASGSVTRLEVADDGSLAVVLGGAELLFAPAGGRLAKVAALSRGAIVTALPRRELRAVSDVVIGPGGALMVIGELYETDRKSGEAKVLPTLLAWSPKRAGDVVLVRQAGEDVVDAAAGSVAAGYAFKRPDGSGSFLVTETFHEGGTDLGLDVSGQAFAMNPQRLLVGHVDTPKALVEVARTGDDQNGISQRSLQAFQDAGRLADGRVLFDANFVEEGRLGWLFVAKPPEVPFAVVPYRYDGGNAPWTKETPRLRHLDTEPEGGFAFLHRSGGVAVGRLDSPVEAKVYLEGAKAYRKDGTFAGTVRSLSRPTLARGGDWLVVASSLEAPGQAARKALLLASREDLDNGVAEVLLEEGGVLPGTARQKLRGLSFAEGREDPLWLR